MKSKLLLSALLATSTFLSVPLAAQAEERPIRVFVEDGDALPEIEFEVDPFIEEGSTLVQFRPIFEKLGLKIEWNGETRTVTGIGDDVKIELQIGNSKAQVNGKEVELAVAPQIKNDVTFVPLRFVGEASGQEVGWDSYNRSVIIAPLETQLAWVMAMNVEYTNQEDIEGFLSQIDESFPNYAAVKPTIAQQFAVADVKADMTAFEVVKSEEGHALIRVAIETKIESGPLQSHVTTTTLQELANINGSWKIVGTSIEKQDFMNSDQFPDQKPIVSPGDEKAIMELIEQQRLLADNEDFKGLKETYAADFPNLDMIMLQNEQVAAVADYSYKVESAKIIQVGAGELKVRMIMAATLEKGPEQLPGMLRTESVETYKKGEDGKWRTVESVPLWVESK